MITQKRSGSTQLLPYFGVSGIVNPDDSYLVREVLPPFGSTATLARQVMINVLVNDATFTGKQESLVLAPSMDQVAKIFSVDPRCCNIVRLSTSAPEQLAERMRMAQQISGDFLTGFQLALPWPEQKQLDGFFESLAPEFFEDGFPRLILELDASALEACGNNPQQVAQRIKAYEDNGGCNHFTDVLLNPTGGKLPFNPRLVRSYLSEIREVFPYIGLGVTGGVGPTNVDVVAPLIAEFPKLSIDVRLESSQIQTYLTNAFQLFYPHSQQLS